MNWRVRQFFEREREMSLSTKIYSLANMQMNCGAGIIVEPIGREPVDGNILHGVLVRLS